jgi:hydroxymethylpyrimidine/phosphomethylpyrimidine kinase
MSAITAITAQNTLGVDAIHALPPEIVLAQIRAVVADIGVDVVKVGMLGSVQIVHVVALALDELPVETPVVVDPVMISESGARLLDRAAEGALVAEILPRASIVTPNIPEARVLAGYAAHPRQGEPVEAKLEDERSEAVALALAVSSLGPGIVVLTGGHRAQTIDLFLERGAKAKDVVEIPGERYPDGAAHGSGCTHSSVLAAQLALGHAPLQAAFTARALAGEAVAGGLRDIGEGPGPVDVIGLDRMRSV